MIYTKDHKTVNIFDPFDYLGPKRKSLIETSWAKIFRDEILPELPVNKLQPYYHSSRVLFCRLNQLKNGIFIQNKTT